MQKYLRAGVSRFTFVDGTQIEYNFDLFFSINLLEYDNEE